MCVCACVCERMCVCVCARVYVCVCIRRGGQSSVSLSRSINQPYMPGKQMFRMIGGQGADGPTRIIDADTPPDASSSWFDCKVIGN